MNWVNEIGNIESTYLLEPGMQSGTLPLTFLSDRQGLFKVAHRDIETDKEIVKLGRLFADCVPIS